MSLLQTIESFITLWPTKVLAARNTVQTDFGEVRNFGDYVSAIMDWAFPILGTFAALMVIYAGYLYMTSQGNQKSIDLAKEIIIGVAVGILLLFVIDILLKQVIGTPVINTP